jgi:hypothetical protein
MSNPKFKERLENKRLYSIYYNMLDRCCNPKNIRYSIYGGRGIVVCEEWSNDRTAFISWSNSNGFADHLQLDRRDNDKGYSPDNCRWVSPKENCRNTSRNRQILYDGQIKTLIEWCELLKIDYRKAHDRLKRGWLATEAFSPMNNVTRRKHPNERLISELKSIIDSSVLFFEAA